MTSDKNWQIFLKRRSERCADGRLTAPNRLIRLLGTDDIFDATAIGCQSDRSVDTSLSLNLLRFGRLHSV
jgi:hypothetical protein